jgi:hypothetical protein
MDVLPEGLMLRFSGTDARGEVLAYRPDDRARDFTLPVGLDSTGRMLIPKGRLAPGMWRIKVNWSMGGKEFYHEQKVSVQ